MAFGLDFRLDDLPALEDEARSLFDRLRTEAAPAAEDRLRPLLDDARSWIESLDSGSEAPRFEADAFAPLLDDLGVLGDAVEVRNLDDLADLAARLPPELSGPDDTGEAPTGSDAIGREEAALAATLSTAPRIVEALGPTTLSITTRGETYAVSETYRDALTGFSALRLTPVDGGAEVFAVDGLQVGSRADTVAAATLGRLQVGSDAFAAMIEDATTAGLVSGGVLFTGPSLGGAIAQAAAHETAQALLPHGVAAGTVRLVTVDPLGGRDATAWLNGGTLDPQALAAITALNLRTDGDVVSRIGSHIGATLTLPAVDETGELVQLSAAEAHANVVSLLQTLDSDALFDAGLRGEPPEISGFARASELASDSLITAWLAEGEADVAPGALQLPGTASLDASGTQWSLDADSNGTVDIAAQLSAPLDPGRADLVL
jgi:hypothetical protein